MTLSAEQAEKIAIQRFEIMALNVIDADLKMSLVVNETRPELPKFLCYIGTKDKTDSEPDFRICEANDLKELQVLFGRWLTIYAEKKRELLRTNYRMLVKHS